jgi:methionine-rich copper-binding protein CopC
MPPRLALIALTALPLAQPAIAHAILIDSTPAPLGHVPAGRLDLVFRYNSRIDAGRSKLTLKRPDQTTTRLTIQRAPSPDLLKSSLDLTPGDYVASWQVLATDGHVTRGTVPFTVDAPK